MRIYGSELELRIKKNGAWYRYELKKTYKSGTEIFTDRIVVPWGFNLSATMLAIETEVTKTILRYESSTKILKITIMSKHPSDTLTNTGNIICVTQTFVKHIFWSHCKREVRINATNVVARTFANEEVSCVKNIHTSIVTTSKAVKVKQRFPCLISSILSQFPVPGQLLEEKAYFRQQRRRCLRVLCMPAHRDTYGSVAEKHFNGTQSDG